MRIKFSAITLLFIGLFGSAIAQDLDHIDKIELKQAADYQQNESFALESANYLLSRPVDKNNSDLKHLKAMQFLIHWMDGTPDYSFAIDASISKATESNPPLLAKYLASMVKYVLENKSDKDNPPSIKYNAFSIFLNYCENTANQVTINKEIKRLLKAKEEGSLREYLE